MNIQINNAYEWKSTRKSIYVTNKQRNFEENKRYSKYWYNYIISSLVESINEEVGQNNSNYKRGTSINANLYNPHDR